LTGAPRTLAPPNIGDTLLAMQRAHYTIGAGFLVFGLCSFWGFRLLLRGLRGDVLDSSGMETASRGWFIAAGMFLQLPLVGFTLFAWKQGFFGS
jgi:hypothetical protein